MKTVSAYISATLPSPTGLYSIKVNKGGCRGLTRSRKLSYYKWAEAGRFAIFFCSFVPIKTGRFAIFFFSFVPIKKTRGVAALAPVAVPIVL